MSLLSIGFGQRKKPERVENKLKPTFEGRKTFSLDVKNFLAWRGSRLHVLCGTNSDFIKRSARLSPGSSKHTPVLLVLPRFSEEATDPDSSALRSVVK